MLVTQRLTPQYRLCRPSAPSSRHTTPAQRISIDDSGGKVEKSTTSTSSSKESMDVNGNPVISQSNSVSSSEVKSQQQQQQRGPQLNRSSNGPISVVDFSKSEDPLWNRDSSMPSDTTHGRRRKKKESGYGKSESIGPEYYGNRSIDDILKIIGNPDNASDNASKRKKERGKASQETPATQNDKTTTNKKVKKGRSSSLTSSPKESEVGSEHGEDSSSRVSEASELKDVSCEQPSQSEVSSVDLNHKMPTSPDPVSMPSDEGPLADMDFPYNDNYIFTDKDIASFSSTDEFQVVCKKKKQKSTGAVTSSSSHREHYDHHFNHFTREFPRDFPRDLPRDFPREYHRHVPVARSVTPPPKSSTRPDKRERAFSPSGFPELGGNGRGCEGRRNSTGNVPIEMSPDDSDLESVKSLPTGTCNDLLSACPVISYAKVAAKPRQANNNIGSVAPSSCSKAAGEEKGAGDETQLPPADDLSPPQHPSPELPTLNDFPASNNCDLQTSCRSISKAKTPTVSSQDKDLPAANQVVISARESTPTSNSGDIFAKDNNKFDLEFVGESHIETNENESCGGQSILSACSRSSSVENSLTCNASQLRPVVSSSEGVAAPSNNAQCVMQNVSKPVENNHKKSTARSVIFMDRPTARDGLVSPSLRCDISFGFEEEPPCDVNKICDKVQVAHHLNHLHKANGLILPSPPQGSSGLTFMGPPVSDFVDEPCHHPQMQVAPQVIHQVAPQVIHQVAPQVPLQVPVATAAGEPSPVDPQSDSQSDPAVDLHLPPVFANLHPVVVPLHLYDPKNDCANFDLEDTVYYIRKEWDRLTEASRKNPNKVIIYCCD